MFHNSARDEGKSGRGTVEPRKRRRWRMRPTVVVLEDRRLPSTFTVTNNASSGAGSLPYEIGLANTAGGANTIVFGSFFNTPQTIALGGTQLELNTANESVTITGPAAGVTVSGGGASRVFLVDASVTASISGLTVSGGTTTGDGGGLDNFGTTTLTNCTVYGGPTQTVALLPGSPAINAGTNGPGIPTTDQRGLGRVGAVDIGAFESQGFTLTVVAGSSPQTSNIGTAFANPLAVSVTANNPVEPVNGGVVTFVANAAANGATAFFLPASSAVIAGSQAAVTAAPNNMDGSYQVTASASGSSPVTFNLTNTGPVFAHLIVNTTSASLFPGAGLLSLPEAVLFADFDRSGNSHITFDNQVFKTPQTITLTGTQLELSNTSETETITGPNNGVTVSGAGLSRVFQVDALVTASISGLTITGGTTPLGSFLTTTGDGGGLANFGTTTLTNCTVNDSSAGYGGGVSTGGTLTMTNCTVRGNSADAGGGVFNKHMCTLTNCTVSGNSATGNGGGINNASLGNTTVTGTNVKDNSAVAGGGLFNQGALNVASSNINNNQATSQGGGVSTTGGTATLTNVTVNNNQAVSSATTQGGGIYSANSLLSLTNCTVNANQVSGVTAEGGGIYASATTVDMQNATVNGNQANGATTAQGGGIYAYQSTVDMQNSTVNGNDANGATAQGGGIYAWGTTVDMQNSTVNGNDANGTTLGQGGGIYYDPTSVLTLVKSTVNGNKATTSGGDYYET